MLGSRSLKPHHLRAGAQRPEGLPPRAGVETHGRIVQVATGDEQALCGHAVKKTVMDGLSEAVSAVFGENRKFDHVEVSSHPMGGDPLRERVTQLIGPILATLTDVAPAVPDHYVVLIRKRQSVPLLLGVPSEESRVPRVVVRVAPHAVVARPYLGCVGQSRGPANQPRSANAWECHVPDVRTQAREIDRSSA